MTSLSAVDPNLRRLIEAHPHLFKNRVPEASSYLTAGWYKVVDELCSRLETVLGADAPAFTVLQIKEKFGHLHFAWRLGQAQDYEALRDRINEIVWTAELAAQLVCETCGAPGKIRSLGGLRTTWCDVHLVDAEARREQAQAERAARAARAAGTE
ncbi:hypothetical protein SNE35_29810 [Paucibacter sp. R3-3]|uniref:Uncharacterized protein n=1 Tax=Roseateles agri TaxID=3098619 RepID=A0ABU5DQY3_9BURK|nr:hypothetical protein [Paucibacter sp. R3-3]MDY0748732.1 hypothetical protein [Paucibacter sp. R3-3]